MTFDPEKFIGDITKVFPWYTKEDLSELLDKQGFYFLPEDLRNYLNYLDYPNHLWQIRDYLSTPEKPLGNVEMYNFWMRLSGMERIELKHMDLGETTS